jgi:hypothetical protein
MCLAVVRGGWFLAMRWIDSTTKQVNYLGNDMDAGDRSLYALLRAIRCVGVVEIGCCN